MHYFSLLKQNSLIKFVNNNNNNNVSENHMNMYHSKDLWKSLICLGIRIINKITDPKRKTHAY